jgi:hypothetical protein
MEMTIGPMSCSAPPELVFACCRGAYFHLQRACLVEIDLHRQSRFLRCESAATILHEAMHARLHTLGFPLEMEDRVRQGRFCRRAEIEFGSLVPGGERVVERAQWSSDLSDEDVAPEIDRVSRRSASRKWTARRLANGASWLLDLDPVLLLDHLDGFDVVRLFAE